MTIKCTGTEQMEKREKVRNWDRKERDRRDAELFSGINFSFSFILF